MMRFFLMLSVDDAVFLRYPTPTPNYNPTPTPNYNPNCISGFQ